MLLLSSLFVFLGMGTVQPVAIFPVQVTEHVSFSRYQFAYQENKYIIDLNAKLKILAYYINNELQNPSLLPSTQRELLQYDEKSNLDLAKTFDGILSGLPRSQGMTTGQSVADIPVQVTEHFSSTRYQFKYQENKYIIDLNAKRKILAYYIENELQNPSLLPSTQKELLQYDEKSKLDLSETFRLSKKRTRREVGGGYGGLSSLKHIPSSDDYTLTVEDVGLAVSTVGLAVAIVSTGGLSIPATTAVIAVPAVSWFTSL